MNTEHGSFPLLSLLILIWILTPGCAQNRQVTAHIDRLTAKIHTQEEENVRQRNELISCRQENARLRQGKSEQEAGPDIQLPGDSKPPKVTVPGQTSETSPVEPNLANQPTGDPPSLTQSTVNIEPANREINPRVERLYLHPHATGGFDTDGKPGDEGLSVLIEPRNAAGQYVPLAAPITVALLDPALRDATGGGGKNQAAVVGRWRFSASQVERMIHASPSGRGIYVRIPWSGSLPKNSRLSLFVRYETVDRRKVETKKEVFIRLPGQIAGWSSRVEDSQSPPVNVARQRHPDQIIIAPEKGGAKRPTWSPNRD